MNSLSNCPFCQGEFVIQKVCCMQCDTKIEGDFVANRFQMFSADDLFFIEMFLKNEGSIKLMEKDLGISYPTVKSRLKKIIMNLGYESAQSAAGRSAVLQKLADKEIDVQEAVSMLDKE